MFKKPVLWVILGLWVLAPVAYYTSEHQQNKPTVVVRHDGQPGVRLEEFWYRRYVGGKLNLELRADNAGLSDETHVELEGNVGVRQFRNSRWTYASAERCVVELAEPVSSSISAGAKVLTVEARDKVRMTLEDDLLETSVLDFDAVKDVIHSSVLVTFHAPGRTMVSKNGLTYSLEDGVLVLPGEVEGVVSRKKVGQR